MYVSKVSKQEYLYPAPKSKCHYRRRNSVCFCHDVGSPNKIVCHWLVEREIWRCCETTSMRLSTASEWMAADCNSFHWRRAADSCTWRKTLEAYLNVSAMLFLTWCNQTSIQRHVIIKEVNHQWRPVASLLLESCLLSWSLFQSSLLC